MQFAKSGWSTSNQLVRAWGKTYRNVVATKYPDWPAQGEELPPLLIGARFCPSCGRSLDLVELEDAGSETVT